MNLRRVVVTGIGVVSPIGCDLAACVESLRHGRHGPGDDQFADLVEDRGARGIVGGQRHAQVGGRQLPYPDGGRGGAAGEGGDNVRAAAGGR